MQDAKIFSEIIKDSLEDLEKEIVEKMDALEKVLQEHYKEDPFRTSHLINSSSDEIEGMVFGVFFTCLQIKSRYFHKIYHWNPIKKLMNRHEEDTEEA